MLSNQAVLFGILVMLIVAVLCDRWRRRRQLETSRAQEAIVRGEGSPPLPRPLMPPTNPPAPPSPFPPNREHIG